MLIYILNFISIALYGALIKNRKTLVTVISIQLFLILALRNVSVGYVDLKVYISGGEYIETLSFFELLSRLHLISTADLVWPFAFESGYTLAYWLLTSTGLSFYGFLAAYAFFVSLSLGVFIYRYSKDPAFSYLAFIAFSMFTYSFYILRQTIAVCILLWAFHFLVQKKNVRFWILLYVAFMFHRAAAIFAILFFFRNRRMTMKKYERYLFLIAAFMLTAPFLYDKVITPALVLIGKSTYTNVVYSLNNQILLMLGICLLIYLFNNFTINFNKYESLMLYALIFSVFLEILGMCNDVFARIIEFLFIFAIILIPNLIMKNSRRSQLFKIAIVVMMFAFYIYVLRGSFIVPYETMFNTGVTI